MKYSNIFYFYNINSIGGVESFFYYLAKKYQDYDITIFYSTGDIEQVKRLKKYVRVKRYRGEVIQCKKAFFNYNATIIDNIEADEYIQIIHADYKAQKIKPNLNPKITKYLGVSKQVCESFKELTGIQCELAYNPVEIDTPDKVIKLISATRLTSEKGKERMIRLGNLLNQSGIPYIWLIFTNDTDAINNPNIIYMKPKLDITTYMKEADFLVQLSSSEAYCFSVVESLILGKPVIATNLPVYEEIGLNDSNSIRLELDFKEIPIERITQEYKFEYKPPKDNWLNILEKDKSRYKEEKEMKYKVEALEIYERENISDSELGRVPKTGEQWIIDEDRLETLLGNNSYKKPFVKMIEEVKETSKPKEEKPVKKTTSKKK